MLLSGSKRSTKSSLLADDTPAREDGAVRRNTSTPIAVKGPPNLPLTAWGIVLRLAIVNTALGCFLYNHSPQTLTALEMNVILNLTPYRAIASSELVARLGDQVRLSLLGYASSLEHGW